MHLIISAIDKVLLKLLYWNSSIKGEIKIRLAFNTGYVLNVVCKKFFDTIGYKSQMVRIAQRLNALEFVEQSDTEKLPTFKEMSTRQRSLVK